MSPLPEPFSALTPGESTQLGGLQHSGVLAGHDLASRWWGGWPATAGKVCYAAACSSVAWARPPCLPRWPGRLQRAPLAAARERTGAGLRNGAFAVAAIGSMMRLVSEGRERRDGMRMGVFGAAQAIAFGLGGMLGTLSIDLSRWLTGSVSTAYAFVFCAQALLFVTAAWLALANQATLPAETSSNSNGPYSTAPGPQPRPDRRPRDHAHESSIPSTQRTPCRKCRRPADACRTSMWPSSAAGRQGQPPPMTWRAPGTRCC